MPPGVPPLVGTHQYIMGQGGIPYFQQPMYYEDLQLMQQQRLAPHIVSKLVKYPLKLYLVSAYLNFIPLTNF